MRITLLFATAFFTIAAPIDSWSQEKEPDPFDKKSVFVKKKPETEVALQLGILLEYFQLDKMKANELLREYSPMATDAKGLRDELAKLIEKGEAKLLDSAYVIARSGQRAKVESIKEYTYPTKFDPPEMPNAVGDITVSAGKDSNLPVKTQILFSEATPTDFEVRNVGITLEVDPVLSNDSRIVDLNLAPELVTFIDTEYYVKPGNESESTGTANIQMPIFYTMKNTTQFTVEVGKENLFGFHTPYGETDERIISMLKVDLIRVPFTTTVGQ